MGILDSPVFASKFRFLIFFNPFFLEIWNVDVVILENFEVGWLKFESFVSPVVVFLPVFG